MKTDAYFDNAVMNAAEMLKHRGVIEFQISSKDGKIFTTLQDDTFSAGDGDIVEAANFGLAVLKSIENAYGKPLSMHMTQSDISLNKMAGIMSLQVQEITHERA